MEESDNDTRELLCKFVTEGLYFHFAFHVIGGSKRGGGAPGTRHPGVQILSFLYSFWQKKLG